ncbi:MAG: hypothetical protein KDA69_18465, partial [Planctomycetaceae bacterium]|nr:hypothetical protein [Planctomycetaceae bacterium]
MSCRLMSAVVVLFGLASQSFGFEVTATIRKIDPDLRVANVFANGQERTVKIAMDAKFLDEAGENLKDGLSAPEFKAGTTVTLTVERNGNTPEIVSIRLGGRTNPSRPTRASVGKPTVGFKPLAEMTAQDRYKGEDGGLYGQGNNNPPAELAAAAKRVTATIQPLDANGKPAANGKIGLVSISMSNATQEFSRFKQLADADPEKSSRVAVVDCAQGGQTMARWADA